MRVPHHETGAALLTVLIIVGVMGAIAATMFGRLRLATTLESNAAGQEQARAFGLVGETLLTARIDTLKAANPQRTTLAGGWQGRAIALPLPIGTAVARVVDGGNCFNLNSLATGTVPDALVTRPIAVGQFAALMQSIDVPEAAAQRIAASAADWIDSDDAPNRYGAEDPVYARAPRPYRTANTLMAEASELRAVNGVTPALYAVLRPWLCALPIAEMSPINVNTLTPGQAPLVAMLLPNGGGVAAARRVIAERPAAGWTGVSQFWDTPTLRDIAEAPAADVLVQPQVTTGWFAVDMQLAVADVEMEQTFLVDARKAPSVIVTRRWTADE